MREIKFRAWDKKEKVMIATGFNIIGEWTIFDCLNQHIKNDFINRLNDIEIMQFVGLKDKNGKEIYEFDIVKCIREDSLRKFNTGIIIYDCNSMKYRTKSIIKLKSRKMFEGLIPIFEDNSIDVDIIYWQNIEVIGNIFDNPELIGE